MAASKGGRAAAPDAAYPAATGSSPSPSSDAAFRAAATVRAKAAWRLACLSSLHEKRGGENRRRRCLAFYPANPPSAHLLCTA